MKIHFKPALLLALLLASVQFSFARINLTFCCAADNDLLVTLQKNERRLARFEKVSEAIAHAPKNSALLILADNYPAAPTKITAADLESAKNMVAQGVAACKSGKTAEGIDMINTAVGAISDGKEGSHRNKS